MGRQEHPRRGRRGAPARLPHQPSSKPSGQEPDRACSGWSPRGYRRRSTQVPPLLGGPGLLGAGSGENALTLRERLHYHPATPWSRGRPFSNLASAMSSANDLAGRVAVVVGAGSGLGRDLASALAERGAKVVL